MLKSENLLSRSLFLGSSVANVLDTMQELKETLGSSMSSEELEVSSNAIENLIQLGASMEQEGKEFKKLLAQSANSN